MDFAAKYGFDGVLVEGWNKGWDGDWTANGDKFSFTEAYPDFDIDAIARYGKAKGVKPIGHNETAGAIENYARQLDGSLKLNADHHVSVDKKADVIPSGASVDGDGGPQCLACK